MLLHHFTTPSPIVTVGEIHIRTERVRKRIWVAMESSGELYLLG